jgi:1,4-alpha-glucan branching enzyme
MHTACVSRFVLDNFAQNGLPLARGKVIYGGTDLTAFQPSEREWGRRCGSSADLPLRLLFAGSISREKGVDTVLKAMALLPSDRCSGKIQLSIVGSGHPDMVQYFMEYVKEKRLEKCVRFHDRIAKEQMPALLQEHDVLIFPSAWEEPLARMMMEGLASGMVLVSTTTGGSKEILRHDDNCLTFEAQDAHDLAAQIQRLHSESGLAPRLADASRSTAVNRLDFQRMANEIESFVGELM